MQLKHLLSQYYTYTKSNYVANEHYIKICNYRHIPSFEIVILSVFFLLYTGEVFFVRFYVIEIDCSHIYCIIVRSRYILWVLFDVKLFYFD